MEKKHYKEILAAYLNGDISQSEQHEIAEHLSLCDECKHEYDTLKFGSSLLSSLESHDAPDAVWANITDRLDGREDRRFGLIPSDPLFSFRKGVAFAAAIVAVSALSIVVFLSLFSGVSPYRVSGTNPVLPANGSVSNGANAGVPTGTNVQVDANTNSSNTNQSVEQPQPADGWQVETIAGMPKVGDGAHADQITVGELLETDARSRARIAVADIGTVDISPNSRVKLVGTDKNEHRLSLERGSLHAKIYAPPRLFVVDTPSAKAVDLGCEYTLDVDKDGNSILRVTGGWVALEREGRESIVPAGMMCLTKKGKGLGTPFTAEATEGFKKALDSFDFSGGGSGALQTIVREADYYDMFTLWHLLSRVRKDDRGLVYDALAKFVAPPAGVTREGIIALNKKMLESWKNEVETAYFS